MEEYLRLAFVYSMNLSKEKGEGWGGERVGGTRRRGGGVERGRKNVFHFPWEGGSDRAEGRGKGGRDTDTDRGLMY